MKPMLSASQNLGCRVVGDEGERIVECADQRRQDQLSSDPRPDLRPRPPHHRPHPQLIIRGQVPASVDRGGGRRLACAGDLVGDIFRVTGIELA